MIEWVLVVTMHIMSSQGQLRDVQIEMIDGFSSLELCEAAQKPLSASLIIKVTNHRRQQGILGHNLEPSIWMDCVKITK